MPYARIVSNRLVKLDSWVSYLSWPPLACPECGEGTVSLDKNSLTTIRDPDSDELMMLIDAGLEDPSELTGTCSGKLTCNNPQCGRTLLVSGDWLYDVNVDDHTGRETWIDYIRVRYISPPLPIFTPPAATPAKVTAAIHAASELLWINPSAAANQLRQAIEELLTVKGIKRTYINGSHKRKSYPAHTRIEMFGAASPANVEVAETLMAVKWIGNSGSHSSDLTVAEVLEGAELLQHALTELYDPTNSLRRARIKEINRKKRIPRSKK